MVSIRAARSDDLASCCSIYNHYVATSVATFDTRPMTGAAAQRWFVSHQNSSYPLLVADLHGEVAAYGSLSCWSSKGGYGRTAEVSLFVGPEHRRRGIGAALLRALIEAAAGIGHHCLIARVEASNAPSIELFRQAGFRSVGVMHEAGFKFDRWLDVLIMERLIEPGSGDSREGQGGH